MTNKEILKKKIIYRSMHRGTKEMDLLLGNFVNKYINKFDDNELIELKSLLSLPDEILLIIFRFVQWDIIRMKPHRVCKRWRALFESHQMNSLRIWPFNFMRFTRYGTMQNFNFHELKYFRGFQKIFFDNKICTRSSRFVVNAIALHSVSIWKCINSISFENCQNITWTTLETVLENCKSLKDLNISRCKALQWSGKNIYKGYLWNLICKKKQINLERLCMNGYDSRFSTGKIKLLLLASKDLKCLEINDMFFILINFLCDNKLEKLKSLSMRRPPKVFINISEESIDKLIDNYGTLENLDIRGCLFKFSDSTPFTIEESEKILKRGKNLKTLTIFYDKKEEMYPSLNEDDELSTDEDTSTDNESIISDDVVLENE